MLNISELEAMSNVEIAKVDRDNLVDIKNINIDTNLPVRQRMRHYIEQVKNPYCFMCGKTLVRICFNHCGKPIDEGLKTYFCSLKST